MREWISGRFKYFPITTSSPQKGKDPVHSSHPSVLIRSALALPEEILESLATLNGLYNNTKRVLGHENPLALDDPIMWIEWWREIGSDIPSSYEPTNNNVGKLGLKVEAAGKMRVFAMVDPWTQWILAPIHKGIFHILERIPTDGTFDQLKPLKKGLKPIALNVQKPMFSMDLSSATDRLPIKLQRALVEDLFDLTLCESAAWVDVLVKRPYALSKKMISLSGLKDKDPKLFYEVGQPMGALSSWAMLAWTHHFIVQVSAIQAGVITPDRWFSDYAILGDDIVIFNAKVAKIYYRIITDLGVECNLAKSLVSPKGLALEFAKRTFYKGNNVSPTPLKELYSALESTAALCEYGRKYHLSIPAMLKVAGYGYKVLGGLNKPFQTLPPKLQYVILGASMMTPENLTSSFMKRYYLKDSTFLKAFAKYTVYVIERLQTVITKDVELIIKTMPGREEYSYPLLRLREIVYAGLWTRALNIRLKVSDHLHFLRTMLSCLNSFGPGFLPAFRTKTSSLTQMRECLTKILHYGFTLNKHVSAIPMSSLSFRASQSTFLASKGMRPSLYRKHLVFHDILKDVMNQPMREAGIIPIRLLSPILRRIGKRGLSAFVVSQATKRLVLASKAVVLGTSLLTLSSVVFGPTKILVLIGTLYSWISPSSGFDLPLLGSTIDIIERMIIIFVFLSGIVIYMKWNTIHTGLQILVEEYADGLDIWLMIHRIIDLFTQTTVMLITEYVPIVTDTVIHAPWYSAFTGGALLGYMT
jgi:hypothetical protein